MKKKKMKNKVQLCGLKNTRKKNILFFMLFCISYISSNAQEMKNHLHTELIAKVGAIYEETPDDNPCAGSEIYLTLVFDKKQVEVAEKEISTCGKEIIHEIGTYDWKLKDSKKIVIDFIPQKIQGTYAENLILALRGEKIIGRITHLNGKIVEYVFKEK